MMPRIFIDNVEDMIFYASFIRPVVNGTRQLRLLKSTTESILRILSLLLLSILRALEKLTTLSDTTSKVTLIELKYQECFVMLETSTDFSLLFKDRENQLYISGGLNTLRLRACSKNLLDSTKKLKTSEVLSDCFVCLETLLVPLSLL